jgi:hypothetical protein
VQVNSRVTPSLPPSLPPSFFRTRARMPSLLRALTHVCAYWAFRRGCDLRPKIPRRCFILGDFYEPIYHTSTCYEKKRQHAVWARGRERERERGDTNRMKKNRASRGHRNFPCLCCGRPEKVSTRRFTFLSHSLAFYGSFCKYILPHLTHILINLLFPF